MPRMVNFADPRGGNVTAWADKSSGGKDLEPASAVTYIGVTGTAAINGKNAIRFNNSSSLTHSGVTNADFATGDQPVPRHLFLVFESDQAGSGTTYEAITDGPDVDHRFVVANASTANEYTFFFGGSSYDTSGASRSADPTIVEVGYWANPATASNNWGFWENGGSQLLAVGSLGGGDDLTRLRIGSLYFDGAAWTGALAEVLLYTGQLSVGDRNDILDYLSDKWGISHTDYS